MSDPQPTPVFTIAAWADGYVTHAEKPTTEENDQ